MKEQQRDSVVDPDLPKAEQEKRVQDEIQKSSEELFGEAAKRDRAGRRREQASGS